ncbi:MAG TPA: hypothetical protein VM076_11120 [Gemmatimonadaceae bacterium]|nr:hypothetical protein [Gemmatimonadaceae bacterium]
MALNNRRIEGSFSQGWPVAIFITALAVGSFALAGFIHKRTFRSPNDVTAQYRKEKSGEHGAAEPAGAEHKAAAH